MYTLFWFRRDLRLNDNAGLFMALKESGNVLPLFIFDPEILKKFPNVNDRRLSFIFTQILRLQEELRNMGCDLKIFYDSPELVFKSLIKKYEIKAIYTNSDYEPSAIARDNKIEKLCVENRITFKSFKDQVIFEKDEVAKDDGSPYTVFTPYKKKWLKNISSRSFATYETKKYFSEFNRVDLKDLKNKNSNEFNFDLLNYNLKKIEIDHKKLQKSFFLNYAAERDFPSLDATSRMGVHLRFGTISVRELAKKSLELSEVWLSELIWREFFMQILFHFPRVVSESFRPEYDKIQWRNDEIDFKKWSIGETGYPLVDAGMKELNQTGYMHNRVRMLVASFLTKHLLIHWSKGEEYFAQNLLDYDQSANNGNWQWAAGSGCDAAPYFRVFNPNIQLKKFDPEFLYVKKWIPNFDPEKYIAPIVTHELGRDRAIRAYSKGLKK